MNRCKVTRTVTLLFNQVADPFAPASARLGHDRNTQSRSGTGTGGRFFALAGCTGAPELRRPAHFGLSAGPAAVRCAVPPGTGGAGRPVSRRRTGVMGVSPIGSVLSSPAPPPR